LSYSTLITEEGINAQYLMVMVPARKVSSWTLESANIYKNTFTYGYVSKVTKNGTEQTLHTSAAITTGKYYWDNDNQVLYVYSTAIATDMYIVYYELYIATKDCHWYRNPLSTSSQEVYYEPLVIKEPVFKSSLSESIIGYMPSQSSQLQLNNAEHWAEKHIYDSSFKNKDINIYHWLGDLETSNIQLVAQAKMGNLSYNNNKISINVLDTISVFDTEWRNPGVSYYASSTFTELDPNYEGRPVRYVYGMMDGAKLINIDYKIVDATTSDNRIWAARDEGSKTCAMNKTVSTGSTDVKTILVSASGLVVGDRVKFNRAIGADEYLEITNVNYASNYIEHSALSGGAMAQNDSVERGSIGWINIEQNGKIYKLYSGRDWTESAVSGLLCVTFAAGLEASLSMETLSGYETITARIYGKTNDVTKGGVAFGSNSTIYGSLCDPSVILFEVLKKVLTESEINLTSFTDLNTAISSEAVGFSLPYAEGENFPTIKDIIINFSQTNLIKLYLDSNKDWKVLAIRDLAADTKKIEIDEIIDNTIRYQINYNDIKSDIIVTYRKQDDNTCLKSYYTSNLAYYLHGIKKQHTVNSMLLSSSDAGTLAQRYAAILGDRSGSLEFSTKNRFFDSYIADVLEVTLEKLPGYDFTKGVTNTKDYSIIEIDKGLRNVNITLDDYKAVNDNPSLF